MRTHALARLFAVAVVLAISASAHSQITTNEKPYSFSATGTRNAPNPVLLDPPDMKKVNAEDAVNDTATNAPIRAAVPIDVNINSEFDGQWEDLPDGGSLWRMTIIASGAQALNIVYDRFWLPDGGKFFVYGSDNDGVVGAVTSEFLHGSMKEPAPFATRPTNGETVTMEYYAPENVTAKPTISVSSIYYGYRYMRSNEPDSKGLGDSGSCQVNVNCQEGQDWQNEKRAVARIYVTFPGGAGWCSGALINNTSNDNTPYLLTANHCLSNFYDATSNASLTSWIFYWEYESQGCSNQSSSPTIKTTTGATLVANNSSSDFALLMLTQDPMDLSNFIPYYLGWDRSGNAGTGGVGIHHPSGDLKKISTLNYPSNNNWDGNTNFWSHYWNATHNGYSVTEGGSSGSPLINNTHHVIGQLFGGSNVNCSAPEQDIAVYGKFSVSWTGNGATDSRRRLMDWLDPQGTNPQTLGGIGIPTLSGPSTLCASGGSYSISNLPTGATISWNCSSNITRQSAQGSNPCTFKANTNGTGTITATITYQGNTYTLQKGGISVGLRATASGPSYIAPMNNGTWTAYPSCGNTPYQYAWYLKKRGTVGGPTLVGTRSSLRLMSIPANLRESGPTWEAEGDTTRGGISRVYYDLYVTVRDSHGAEYTPPTMSVSTEKNYIISLGYKKGDYEDDASDDSPVDTEPTLTLSPNPAGEYVDIRIDFGGEEREPPSYVMEILNTGSYPVRNAVLSGGYNRVSVQGLQRGYYVVRIRYGDTVLTKPLMVD